MTTALTLRREFAPVVIPDQQVLLNEIADDLENIRDLEVDSTTMAEVITESIGRLATVADKLDADRLATTKPLRDGADWVNAGYNPAINQMKSGITAGKEKLKLWKRKVDEENARIARELEAKKKTEAAAIAAEAEAQRKEAERLAAESAKESDPDKQAALIVQAQAQADAAQQTSQAAQQVANAPVVLTPVRFADPVKGSRSTWKGRVVNRMAIHHEIAKLMEAGRHAEAIELDDLFDFNDSKLNAIARIQKGNLRVPGCVSYEDEGISVRKQAVQS